ncbi:MAG: sulfatase [Planctomycetota bacterium]
MASKPNILLFCADQLRADALGCYGSAVCQTPHLDALAASGTVFENAMTPNPICVPARASITTGHYSHRATGTKNNGGLIRDDQPRLAAHFAAHGYETYACGKLHYVPYPGPGEPRRLHGFQHCDLTESGRLVRQHDPYCKLRGLEDYIDYLADVGWEGFSRSHGSGNNDVRPCPWPIPAEHHVDHWVADRAIQRLGEHLDRRAEKPFLIWCSFPKPHSPYDPPHDYVARYNVQDIPPPAGDESMLADRNPYMARVRITHAHDSLSPAARRVIKMYYYALVTHQDAQVGRVMQALRDSGEADNTLVVYMADHGDLMGDFGTYFKCTFLEGSVRVPILFAGAGVPQGERRPQLVGLQDILPTLATAAGCPLGARVHGLDLSAALADAAAPVRDVFYSQCIDAPRQSAMVCDGRWKYCWAQEGPTEELYDLAEDPQELTNLATGPDGEALCRPWRERLMAEARKVGDTAILDGDGLVSAPLDREAIETLPVKGMGWRWF